MPGPTTLRGLGLSIPVIAAPMAGGPTTPDLVTAAAGVGSIGFLAAGYLLADALADQIHTVTSETDHFGVNLFAPNPVPADPNAYGRYRDLLRDDADRYGVELPAQPVEDDDDWQNKVDVLLARPVPIVSFTFGIPDRAVLAALRKAGSVLVQTVTSAEEARRAADAGVDMLAVQAATAGGHWGTLTPDRLPPARPLSALLAEIATAVDLPLIGAGAVATPDDVAAALRAGASAVMVGTALLLAPESGTSVAYRAALAQPHRGDPILTRAFTGRPARGLRNTFLDRYDADAPAGYPAIHYLTSPLRRASREAGDPEFINLWAGTGYRAAAAAPAGEVLQHLASSASRYGGSGP
jgi:NAD(P)H-dependent flavin oxidoreductase YrpB (nitropropane dioxygenase family)